MRHKSYSRGHAVYRGQIQNRVSIEERAPIVNARKRLGDYEIDLMVGPKNRGAILTIIDRASRFCLLEKLSSKSANEVSDTIIALLKSSSSPLFTITTDNGTEFAQHQKVATNLNMNYYFAHPYASYERGSIENLNGLIRQYIPKGTNFDDIDEKYVKILQEKLNKRPRKVLGFLSPKEYTNKIEVSQLDL